MPRIFDFAQFDPYKSGGYLPVLRYGHGELTPEFLKQEADGLTQFCERHFQFYTGITFHHPSFYASHGTEKLEEWKLFLTNHQEKIDQVHKWLSFNTSGPWIWNESSQGNNGHELGVFIHIERHSDQKNFMAAWPDIFEYHSDSESNLENLAVLKRVLSAKIEFFKWLENNDGFIVIGPGKSQPRLLKFQHPEIEDRFLDDYPGTFEKSGKGFYKIQNDSRFYRWLTNNEPFQIDLNCFEDGKRLISIQTRYPYASALFAKQWGQQFKPVLNSAQNIVEFRGEWPENKPRKVPDIFLDYLSGKCDFSAVPVINTWPSKKTSIPLPQPI